MAIAYIHPETNETVQREAWRWTAIYNDGTVLNQFEVSDRGAIFHRSSEIDASKLIELQLLHDTYRSINIHIPEGAQPIHLYRIKVVHEQFPDPNRPDGSDAMLTREWKIKIWGIGFKLDGRYWLAYTDEHANTIFSSDRELFLEKALP